MSNAGFTQNAKVLMQGNTYIKSMQTCEQRQIITVTMY